MALISPGVEVTVIDESQYIPAATNSVPYFLIATAQNKVSGAGVGVAAGTLAANANRIYLITSQRDLSATFGVPFFYKTTAGTPINGYELNEYGLFAREPIQTIFCGQPNSWKTERHIDGQFLVAVAMARKACQLC
jgi:hypothetical protein